MRRRTLWWLSGLGAGAVAITGIVIGWFAGQDRWWALSASLSLTDEQVAAVDACADPGWIGLLRVLEQDLRAPRCGVGWFAAQVRVHVSKRHPRRRRWLRIRAREPSRTPIQRIRAGTALLALGESPPTDLAVLMRVADPPVSVSALVDHLGDDAWPDAWTGPDVRAARVLADPVMDDPDTSRTVADALRFVSLQGDVATRTDAGEAVLAAMGLEGILAEGLSRRASGRSLNALPARWSVPALGAGQVCAEPGSPGCLRWLADRVDAPPGTLPVARPAPAALPIRPVWQVLDGQSVDLPWAREQVVRGWAAWVAMADEADRARRLRALVLGGATLHAPAAGPVGVLASHTGRPWSTALTASLVGDLADVPVSTGVVEDGHWLRIGKEVTWLDGCGRPVPSSAPEGSPGLGEAWPMTAVLAQVAVELAAARSDSGDEAIGLRLRRLAHALDPVGVPPVDRDAPPAAAAILGGVRRARGEPAGARRARARHRATRMRAVGRRRCAL